MNEVLSQDEIDQLLTAISSGSTESEDFKPVNDTRKIKIYDFKRPDKFSKERTFVNVILSDDMQAMIDLREFLIAHKITNLTTDGYTKDWSKSIAITAYADTREQSRLIDNYLNNSKSKFKRIIQNK